MILKIIVNIITWSIGILLFFPIFWMFITSFKTEMEAIKFPPSFIFNFTLSNYFEIQERSNYFKYAVNSITISLGSTFLAILLSIPVSWSLAFIKNKYKDFILLWILSTKMMPAVGVLVPMYIIFRDIKLMDTLTGMIIILTLTNLPILVWLLYNYFVEIPYEIVESSQIDGATIYSEITHIILPLSLPGISSAFLLSVILCWNEAFWTLMLTSTNSAPLSVFIASFSSPEGLFWAKLSAASVMAILPIMILGWFSQKQLVAGLTFGAIK
ncbi:MAG: carbohydrate ABC transporter permease [SAR324 cluster bacterium]|jgi:sorbitol/mannitol transport system permease protein|nr:sugar ABC transporter permease [Bacteroidota bacterium]MDP7332022.1 carbohydrate ABC transporter permease [SAR324 cluster bacterium]|tara:strand:+ start:5093 stop:5902 length:810 start_codon:yes stop_codon:yes gene_type:complete